MPLLFIPKHSGQHRRACLALYRALLAQCPRVQLPAESFRGPINPVKFQIRKHFQKHKHDTSARHIVAALKVGYEAEELLRTAGDGIEVAKSKVLDLLKDIHAQGDVARLHNAGRPAVTRPQKEIPAPFPGAPRVIDVRPRPKSELSGRRHVPKLIDANANPMLLFKKPQSEFLSRVLSDKIKKKQKQVDTIDRAELLIDMGNDEETWDRIIPNSSANTSEKSWSYEAFRTMKVYQGRIKADNDNDQKLASKFLSIVDQERTLFEQERKERKMQKNAVRLERRVARQLQGEDSQT